MTHWHIVKGLVAQRSACGKYVYRSEEAALRGIAQQNRTRKRRGIEPIDLRPYKCPACERWHVTRKNAKSYWEKR